MASMGGGDPKKLDLMNCEVHFPKRFGRSVKIKSMQEGCLLGSRFVGSVINRDKPRKVTRPLIR